MPPSRTVSGNALTRKVGPWPVWAWAAAAIGAYLVYRAYAGRSAGGTPVGPVASGGPVGSGTDASGLGGGASAPAGVDTSGYQAYSDILAQLSGQNAQLLSMLENDSLNAGATGAGSGGGPVTGGGPASGGGSTSGGGASGQVAVPNLVGMAWQDAKEVLRGLGIRYEHTGGSQGIVGTQSVAAGTLVGPGASITTASVPGSGAASRRGEQPASGGTVDTDGVPAENSTAQQESPRYSAATLRVAQTPVPASSADFAAGAQARTAAGAAAGVPVPFGGVVGVRTLANGSTLTTYASGRKVQQVPGKSAYVVHA